MSMIVDRLLGKDGSMVQTEIDGDHVKLSVIARNEDEKALPLQIVFTPAEATHIGLMLLHAARANLEITACVTYTNGPGNEKKQLPFAKHGGIVESGEHFTDE